MIIYNQTGTTERYNQSLHDALTISQARVIGEQAHGASAVARSWQTGQKQIDATCDTWAEGMATRVPAEMTMEIMSALMDDVILVDAEQLRQASYLILDRMRTRLNSSHLEIS